jgi:hypothetical protein
VALRVLADRTGLTAGLSQVATRDGFVLVHDRGRVLIDTAVMIADGGRVLSDQRELIRSPLPDDLRAALNKINGRTGPH